MRYLTDGESVVVGKYYLGYGTEEWGEDRPDIAYIFTVDRIIGLKAEVSSDFSMSRIYGWNDKVFKFGLHIGSSHDDFYELTEEEILTILVASRI